MRVFTCRSCSRIHIEIGNTQIHFNTLAHLNKYLDTLDSIDADYYAALNRGKGLTKVIILPLAENGTAHLGFTRREFETLKDTIRSYINRDRKNTGFKIELNNYPTLILN